MNTNLENAFISIRQFWCNRQVIILTSHFGPSSSRLIKELQNAGAYVIGVVCGSTNQLNDSHLPNVYCASDQGEKLDRYSFENWLLQDNPNLQKWLDTIDKDKKVLMVGTVFTESPEIFEREVHGWRRPEWSRWEDKTEIDSRLKAIGIATPKSKIVSLEKAESIQWPSQLDEGYGLIIARDSTDGYLGDSQQLRWITNKAQFVKTLVEFRGGTKKIRIAPFVPGVPCSILGLVADTGVAVFDPIEIITLRSRKSRRLIFCGSSTRWRPKRAAILEMRKITSRIGREMASADSYRGIFSVDGVLASSGFLVTEVNPRHASGLGLREAWPAFPTYLFSRAVRHAIPGMEDLSISELESFIRKTIRERPSHNISIPMSEPYSQNLINSKPLKLVVKKMSQKIEAEANCDSLRLLRASPAINNNLLSQATAALARSTVNKDVLCYNDGLLTKPG